jgi:hypothetical protein
VPRKCSRMSVGRIPHCELWRSSFHAMKGARAVIVLLLVIGTMASCSASPGDLECHPQDRLIGVNESAADRALICLPSVEVDGVGYYADGCFAVDASFLGPFEGISKNFVARSIKGAPSQIALAFRGLDSEYGLGCVGWHVWGGLGNTQAEQAAVERLICRVHPPGIPVLPKRFCRQFSSANVAVH